MFKKTALYTSFVTASLADAAIFITTTTYIQLTIAILLYLPLTYFAFKLFSRKSRFKPALIQENLLVDQTSSNEYEIEKGKVEISDIDKRAFLKIIGAAGLSFFISSLFSKKIGSNILGVSEQPGVAKIQDPKGEIITQAKHHPTDNYKISEVDYGIVTYYGFIDQNEGWFIMKEDFNAGTYRYIKGDANFKDNWNNRTNIKYDYFNQVFPES